MKIIHIGIIGCGNISSIYLENLQNKFDGVCVWAVADLDQAKAQAAAEKYQIPHVLGWEEIINHPLIDIVLNLTTPKQHYQIARQSILAGKSVYGEKPLAIDVEEGFELVRLAQAHNVLLGSAPDTFLGAGMQTCLEIILSGKLGTIVAATAFMGCAGHESWHPDPAFYYQIGGGPMYDMGPYYLSALFALLGPACKISGSAKVSFPERTITSEAKKGQKIKVEVPTHVTGVIEFISGAVGTIITSFDMVAHHLPYIEIYGSLGTLSVPDPNTFGGPVKVRYKDQTEFEEISLTKPYEENSRGLGVWEMALALQQNNQAFRANGNLGLHVLEAIHGFHVAAEKGQTYNMRSTFEVEKLQTPHTLHAK